MTNHTFLKSSLIPFGRKQALRLCCLLVVFFLSVNTALLSASTLVKTSREQIVREREQLLIKVKMEQASSAEIERLAQIDIILAQPPILEKSESKPASTNTVDQAEITDINK